MKTFAVVVYDIESDERRRQLVRLLEGYGERVQRSVFECDLTGRELRALVERLRRFARPEDAIRVYQLPPHTAAATLILGGRPRVATPETTIL